MEKKRFKVFEDELWDAFKAAIFTLLSDTDPDNPIDVMGTLSAIEFAIADAKLGISRELVSDAYPEDALQQWALSAQGDDH